MPGEKNLPRSMCMVEHHDDIIVRVSGTSHHMQLLQEVLLLNVNGIDVTMRLHLPAIDITDVASHPFTLCPVSQRVAATLDSPTRIVLLQGCDSGVYQYIDIDLVHMQESKTH